MKLSDLNIYDIGHSIQLSGCIYSGNGKHFLCFFPDENADLSESTEPLIMDREDWVKFIRQTDLLEVEIVEHNPASKEMVKAILRKSQRQIDASVSWKVFKRDGYRCRYCNRDDVPLTVDHLVLWEQGGPSIEENLITACKKCNKTRGNMLYADWLNSDYYKKVSRNLDDYLRYINQEILKTESNIPRVVHKRSR